MCFFTSFQIVGQKTLTGDQIFDCDQVQLFRYYSSQAKKEN